MPSKKDRARVLVIGCGFAGTTFASRLAEKARKFVEITVIERKKNFQLPASFQWIALGWKKPTDAEQSLRPLVRKGVKIVHDTVTSLNLQKRIVKSKTERYPYDHLVIAAGADYAPDRIPGLDEYSYHTYDLEHTIRFGEALRSFNGESIVVGVSRMPFKCPPAPYEMGMLLEQRFRSTGRKVSVEVFSPEPQPLPAAGPVIGRQMVKMLESRGIPYRSKTVLKRVEKGKAVFEGGEEIAFDLLYTVPPHVCPKPIVDAGLTDGSGWVPVNPQTLSTKYENVYALGDVASVQTSHGHVPFLPKAGVFARGQAQVLADNLATFFIGSGEMRAWDGTGYCYLATGNEEAAYLRGSFLSNPPRLEFHTPSQKWYVERLAFEKEILQGVA